MQIRPLGVKRQYDAVLRVFNRLLELAILRFTTGFKDVKFDSLYSGLSRAFIQISKEGNYEKIVSQIIFEINVAIVYHYWYTFVMKNYDAIYEYAADNYGLITSNDAKTLGIPNVEIVKLAHRGRLQRLGHGVYRIMHYIPTTYDKYAEAIALVGKGAAIYGESVLAMHGLALVNPAVINIAVQNRIRKRLPAYLNVILPKKAFDKVYYEGIPSQSVAEALLVCKETVMADRLIEAVGEAERQGLISEAEAKMLL